VEIIVIARFIGGSFLMHLILNFTIMLFQVQICLKRGSVQLFLFQGSHLA